MQQRLSSMVPVLCSVVFASVAQPLEATLIYSSVTRSVATDAFNGCTSDPHSHSTTNNNGNYSHTVQSQVLDQGPDCQGDADALATQNTTITPLSIIGTGYSDALGIVGGAGLGDSMLVAAFSVAQATSYSLNATLQGREQDIFNGGIVPNSGTIVLQDSSLNVIHFLQSNSINGDSFSTGGTLAPGSYSLHANAGSNVGSDFYADASFDFAFVVPEPTATTLLILIACCGMVCRRLPR